MPQLNPQKILLQAHQRISSAREGIGAFDYLCSGTLLKRMVKCGKPNCRCTHDPAARHGPYYMWGHMVRGKLVHRYVTPEQARVLAKAIANYRKVQQLLRSWESETERVLDARYADKR